MPLLSYSLSKTYVKTAAAASPSIVRLSKPSAKLLPLSFNNFCRTTTTTTTGRDVFEFKTAFGRFPFAKTTAAMKTLADFGLPAAVEKVDTAMTVAHESGVSTLYLFVGDGYYT